MNHNARGQLVSTDSDSLSIDETFSLLSNSRRRAMLRVMFEHERMDFSRLVDRVAEIEYGLDIDEISSDERHTIYVSCQQSHLSQLEKHDVLRKDGGSVGLGENADELAEWISKIDGQDSLAGKLRQVFA